MSLFAHLAFKRFSDRAEDLATEALCYLLDQSAELEDALCSFLHDAGVDLPRNLQFASQVSGDRGERPDVIAKADGREVLLIEAKFGAGLTENQPVTYLERLLPGPGCLLFIVPDARVESVWFDVVERARQRFGTLTLPASTQSLRVAQVHGELRMVLTSWKRVLEALQTGVEGGSNTQFAEDLRQLRGLVNRVDEHEFLPLTSFDLTSKHYARILDFQRIPTDVFRRLEAKKVATRSGLSKGNGLAFVGEYFVLGRVAVFLTFNLKHWLSHGVSPIWLVLYGKVASVQKTDIPAAQSAIRELRHASPRHVTDDDNGLPMIALELRQGVDREKVIDGLVERIVELLPILEKALPEAESSPG